MHLLTIRKIIIFSLMFIFSSASLSLEPSKPSVFSAMQQSFNPTLSMQVLIAMTFLTLLPSILMMMTSFTRIIIVLSILRQAIGLAQTPTNTILVGISLFLTFFIMNPILNDIYDHAFSPYVEQKIGFEEAVDRAKKPIKTFMSYQVRKKDLALFSGMAKLDPEEKDIPMHVLIPAFVTSELKTAFQIGFLIFLPFLVIDLVVSSILMSMGMMMLSPMIVSLPFKIMLFVLMDGWTLTLGSLVNSFGSG